MTTTIDHAIQIPAATGVVWAQVSNPDYFPRWQVDCKRITYLTTQHKGKGTRLRCTSATGKEYVLEITAWYEGLGFEYHIVDGGAYEENRGRLRLQEVAEGTVVQWTFTYALGGVFGGLRNSMGMRRTIENQIVDSLKNFYRYLKDTNNEESIKLIKAQVKDAPNVEQRATYQPRHPSRYEETRRKDKLTTGTMRAVGQQPYRPIIEEPLPAEDDTRPHRAITTDEQPALPSIGSFLASPPVPPLVTTHPTILPAPAPGSVIPSKLPPLPPPPDSLPKKPDILPIPVESTPPIPVTKNDAPPAEPVIPAAALPPLPVAPTQPPAATPKPEIQPSVDPSKADASRLSVFEVFGLQKPSETQQMRAVQLAKDIREQLTAPTQERLNPIATVKSLYSDDEKAERAAFMSDMPDIGDIHPPDVVRSGLRSRMRQNLLALRRPKKK